MEKKKSIFTKIVSRYHKNHNPNFDIIEGHVNKDYFITYCGDIKTGAESMEYYSGENYIFRSDKKSFSRVYQENRIPLKYQAGFAELKEQYININK